MQKITLTPIADAPVHLCCPKCGATRLIATGEGLKIPGGGSYCFTAGNMIHVQPGDLVSCDCPSCGSEYYSAEATFLFGPDTGLDEYFAVRCGARPAGAWFQASLTGAAPWIVEVCDTAYGLWVMHHFPHVAVAEYGEQDIWDQGEDFQLARWDALKACSQEIASWDALKACSQELASKQ